MACISRHALCIIHAPVLCNTAGVALLASTLNHLAKMADKCPFTFVTTHFREVFDFDLLRTRHLVSLLHMDFLKEKTEVRIEKYGHVEIVAQNVLFA